MTSIIPSRTISVGTISAREASLVRSITQQSFFEFVKEFWSVIIAEDPVLNWHIKYLCDEFQEDAERVFIGEPKRFDTICNISPGSTKSTILSVMAHPWIQTRMISARSLCASHTAQLTYDLSRKARMVVQSDLYRASFPEIELSSDQNAKNLWYNTRGGGRMACTVGGMSPMGFHAHFHLVDDPIDPQKAASEVSLAAANHWMDEVLPTRKVNKEVTVMWLIMQRLHQDDPSGHIGERENIRRINLPAEKTVKVRPAKLRRKYIDGLMDPIRLSRRALDEAADQLGGYGYAGQFLQDPIPKGGGMFKTARIEIDVPPLMRSKRWISVVRYWDKAGTAKGGAYTVGLLMGRERPIGAPKDGSMDTFWVLDVVRGQWDSAEREEIIVATAKMDTHQAIIGIEQEPGSGGKESAQMTIRRLSGYVVVADRPVGDKESRADPWSVAVNNRQFKMVAAEWNKAFIDEMRHFPNSKYKDQADAGSGAYAVCIRPGRKVGAM